MNAFADMPLMMRRMAWNALKQVIVPAIGTAVLAYFIYYAIHGDRGILAKHRIEGQIAAAERALAEVRDERQRLEVRANRLRADQLDLDLLEERATELLNYAHPGDVFVDLPKLYDEEPDAPAR